MRVLALLGILQSVQFFNGSVLRASGKPIWQFNITLVNAICTVIGFLIAVQWGIVAVATSFVIVGYLLAPLWFVYIQLAVYVVAGGLTYALVIALTARSLYSQLLNLVTVAVPGRKLRKTS
jgi:hypothetical protein